MRAPRNSLPPVLVLVLVALLALPAAAPAAPSFTIFGAPGSGAGQFDQPKGVALDTDGNVYVADSGNHRIQKWSKNLAFLFSFGVQGSGEGELQAPAGVAVDSKGNIYVADPGNDRVAKFDSAGDFLLDFGFFADPVAVEVDDVGHVLVADAGDDIVVKFAPDATLLDVYGKPGGGAGSAVGEFDDPLDLDIDPTGDTLVADGGNSRVQKFDPLQSPLWQSNSLGTPAGLDHDLTRHTWVTDQANGIFRELDPDGVQLGTFGSPGTTNPGEFAAPYGIAVDCTEAVFVADSGNDRMQRYGEAIDPGAPPCVAPDNTASPELSGEPEPGSALALDVGTWTGSPTPALSYRWQRCRTTRASSCGDIAGERALVYTVTEADRGLRLRAVVVGSNILGTLAEATDMTTEVPTVTVDPLPPVPPNPPPTPPTPPIVQPTVTRTALAGFRVECPPTGQITCTVRGNVVGRSPSGRITLARVSGAINFSSSKSFTLQLTRRARGLIRRGYDRRAVLQVFVDGKRRLTARVRVNRRTAKRFRR